MRPSFTVDGDGDQALVLSNSLGATLDMWDSLVEPLSQRRRVVRYDHRGHGNSPVSPGPYTLDAIAGDVIEILDVLELERVSFLGVSLGGSVGLWLAAHAPERIDRLVVCCSSPHMPPPSAWRERAEAVRNAGSVEAVADGVLDRWLTPEFAAAHPQERARLRRMLVGTPPDAYGAYCEAIGAMDLRPVLGLVRAPTLVIAAARDATTPPGEHGLVIADGVADARFEVIADAAHIAPVQQPQRVLELVTDHLAV